MSSMVIDEDAVDNDVPLFRPKVTEETDDRAYGLVLIQVSSCVHCFLSRKGFIAARGTCQKLCLILTILVDRPKSETP